MKTRGEILIERFAANTADSGVRAALTKYVVDMEQEVRLGGEAPGLPDEAVHQQAHERADAEQHP